MQARSRLVEMENGIEHQVPSLAKKLWAIDSYWFEWNPWKMDQVLVEGHTAKNT